MFRIFLPSLTLTLLLMPFTAMPQPAFAPEQPATTYEAARAAAMNGDYDTAARIYLQLLSSEPDNSDYLLGLGQTLLWQEKPEQAVPYLQHGIRLTPGYQDLHQVLFQALLASGQSEQAESVRANAAEQFNNPPWTQAMAAASTIGTRLSMQLSNQLEFPAAGQPDWRYTTLELGLRTPKKNQAAIQLQNSERFGQADTTVGVNGYYHVTDHTGIFISTAFSPTHEVMPERNLHVQLTHALGNGWGGIGGLKHTAYSESDVVTGDLTLERYMGNYRAAYTLVLADSDLTGKTIAHRLQLGRYFATDSQIQVAWTTGQEIEKLTDANTLLSSRVDSIAVWGEIKLTPNTGLLYTVGKTWIEPVNRPTTDREFINFGFNHYF